MASRQGPTTEELRAAVAAQLSINPEIGARRLQTILESAHESWVLAEP
jgi:ATP-dependent protease HslVU (ClpYQ) ATPase subunit